MTQGRAKFEVHKLQEERWVLEHITPIEAEAMAKATAVLGSGTCEGIRVIREWKRGDGIHTEKVVREEMAPEDSSKEKKFSLSSVDTANLCEDFADIFTLPSRITIGRMLRKYLNDSVLTPTELLHHPRHHKAFMNAGTLYGSAVGRISTLQASSEGGDAKARAEFLYNATDTLQKKAKAVQDNKKLPKLTDKDMAKLRQSMAKVLKPEDITFGIHHVLAEEMVSQQSWTAKLAFLLELVSPGMAEEDFDIIDGILADILAAADAVQEILGYQRNLAYALCSLTDTVQGLGDGDEIVSDLNSLFATGRLRLSRAAILDRIRSEIERRQPLNRHDPEVEHEAFQMLLKKLIMPEGMVGGGPTALSVTRRAGHEFNKGAEFYPEESMDVVLAALNDPRDRMRYLVTLYDTRFGKTNERYLVKRLDGFFVEIDNVAKLAGKGSSPKDRMQSASSLQRMVLDSSLPEEVINRISVKLDDLVTDYLEEQQIIERLDNPKAPLRIRATRLVQFCGSGVLTKGKADTMARNVVVTHLRQQAFMEKFTEGIDDAAKKEEVVKSFHQMLAEAGFS